MPEKPRNEDPEATQVVETQSLDETIPVSLLPSTRRFRVVVYSIALALAATTGLILLVSYGWYMESGQEPAALSTNQRQYILMTTLFTMLVAGAAGGALSNLREFIALGRGKGGLPARLEIPFYLRPLASAATGVVVFFVLNYFIAVLSVGSTTNGWGQLNGRLAYVAIALMAGFGLGDLREMLLSVLGRKG